MRQYVVKCVETNKYLTGKSADGGVSHKATDAKVYTDEGLAASAALAVTSVTTNTYRVVPI